MIINVIIILQDKIILITQDKYNSHITGEMHAFLFHIQHASSFPAYR